MAENKPFEISEEDLVLALVQMGRSASQEVLKDVYEKLDRYQISDAASEGKTEDERNDLAQEEIARQIRQMDS